MPNTITYNKKFNNIPKICLNFLSPNEVLENRITSYNVCYTKLLRFKPNSILFNFLLYKLSTAITSSAVELSENICNIVNSKFVYLFGYISYNFV